MAKKNTENLKSGESIESVMGVEVLENVVKKGKKKKPEINQQDLVRDLTEKQIEKEYGNVLIPFSSYEKRPEYIIRTIPNLDIAINGGLRLGSTLFLSGKHSSGKTTMSLYLAGQAQKQYDMPVYYLKTEGRLHKSLVNSIEGINKDKFKIIESIKGSILFAEKQLQILVDLLKVVDKGLYIIDSLSMLCPEKEFENEMDEDTMMVVGRLAAKFFRKACMLVGPTNSIVIFIAQERAIKAATAFSKKTDASGGSTVRFQNDLHISCRKGTLFRDESKKIFGHELMAKIEKLSWGSGAGSEIEIPIFYGEGVSELKSLLDVCVQVGLIDKTGAWFKYEGENIGQGYLGAMNFLKENTEIVDVLKSKVDNMFFSNDS